MELGMTKFQAAKKWEMKPSYKPEKEVRYGFA